MSSAASSPFSPVAALIVVYSALFTVYQTQQALVVRLGQLVRVVNEPGLHVKVPFIDSVIDIDKRILDLEAPAQEVIASDQKRLVVDAFARYRITGSAALLPDARLESRRQFAARDPAQLGAAPRARRGDLHPGGARRARRADGAHPRSDQPRGRELRHSGGGRAHPARRPAGAEQPGGLSAHADRAPARGGRVPRPGQPEARRKFARRPTARSPCWWRTPPRKSEQIRGEGDATRNQIFADAFNQDPDFFAFYRSMQAYETGMKHRHALAAQAGFGLLPLLLRSGGPRRAEHAAAPSSQPPAAAHPSAAK